MVIKLDKNEITYSHTVNMQERKSIIITGCKKIENFDDEEFLIETTLGYMIVKGSGLEILKLDTMCGNVSIKGKINSIAYVDGKNKEKDDREERELIKNGVKILLQSNLTNVFYVHNELGQIEDYKLKNWYNELKEYEALGGNDYMHVLESKMSKLKIVHTDILNN